MTFFEFFRILAWINLVMLLCKFFSEIYLFWFKLHRMKSYKGEFVICLATRNDDYQYTRHYFVSEISERGYSAGDVENAIRYSDQYSAYKDLRKPGSEGLFIKEI